MHDPINTELSGHRVSKARSWLVINQPFFGTLSLKLKIEEAPQIEKFTVNGKVLRYNPELVAQMSDDHLRAVIAHEVMHCALGHQARRGARNHKTWNEAGDYAINGILKDAGFELPEDGLMSDSFKGQSAESIYEIINVETKDDGEGEGDGKGGGGNGQNEGGGQGTEESEDQPNSMGTVEDGEDDSQQEAEDWQNAMTTAAQFAAGKAPEEVRRMVEKLLRPKLDWRDILRRFMLEHDKSDYAFIPPNRRFVSQGIYLPSLHGTTMGEVVVAVDTSGSVSSHQLEEFASEISEIMEAMQPEAIRVVYCDARVAGDETFRPGDPVVLDAKGGGGTKFKPVFDWVQENLEQPPICLVYMTDMASSDLDRIEDPGYDTLWIKTPIGHARYWDENPSFGEVVEYQG